MRIRSVLIRLWICVVLLAPAVSDAQIDVRGTLLSVDGHPMAMAHLVVASGPTDTTIIAQADRFGRYSLSVNQAGGYGMYATGVHHKTLTMPLILTGGKEVELHIRLRANDPVVAADSLYVIPVELEAAHLMQPTGSGRFVARVPAASDTLAYRIRVGGAASEWSSDRLIPGTAQDRYAFNRSGPFWDREADYYSVVDVAAGQELQILYDPSLAAMSTGGPAVGSSPAEVALLANIYLAGEESKRELGENSDNFVDFLLSARRIRRGIKKQLRTHTAPLVRQWLMMQYFDLSAPSIGGGRLAREAIAEIPADSPLWSYEAWSLAGASNLISRLNKKADDDDLIDEYVRRVIESHPDPGVRVQFLYYGVERAHQLEDEKSKWEYYSRIQYSHADTRQAEWLRRDYDPDRQLQSGNPVPEFAFVSFEDSTVTITDHSLRGRVYLLDFWGTWCAPCIEEIPALERAYAEYHDRGFEILSIAFLDDPADIEAFREGRYPMPWLHTRVSRRDDSRIRDLFEITSFPRPVLVSESGIILAIDHELRGDGLEDAVQAAFEPAE